MLDFWKFKYSQSLGLPTDALLKSFSRKTLSDFNKQIEKYFVWKGLESDDFSKNIILLSEFRKRNIEKYFEKLLCELKKYNNKHSKKSFPAYTNWLKINLEEYFHYYCRSDVKKLSENYKEHIKILEFLALKSSLFSFINDKIYGLNDDIRKLINYDLIFAHLEKNSLELKRNHPSIWILYLLSKINIESNNDKYLRAVFEFIKKNQVNVADELIQLVYETLFRILIYKINYGYYNDSKIFYEILLYVENKGILKSFRNTQTVIYLTFVYYAIEFNNIGLAEKLIFEHNYIITESARKQVLNICLAMIAFSDGNYIKAKNLLLNVKTNEPYSYFFCKTLLLKTYYEQNETRNIYPLIDSVMHYIKRHLYKNKYTPFVDKFFKYLNILASPNKSKEKKLELLKPALAPGNSFYQKRWIVEKYNLLKNSP